MTTSRQCAGIAKHHVDIYPEFFAPTWREVNEATKILEAHYSLSNESHPLGPMVDATARDWGSHDREIVRDIMLARRGRPLSKLEHGAVVARMLGAGVAEGDA